MEVEALELVPETGSARLLFVLLHDTGARNEQLLPLAHALRHVFPDAAFILPQAFVPALPAMPAFLEFVRAQQQRFAIVNPDTALAGFGEGGTLALEATTSADGLAGRVLAFAARFARWPGRAPELTAIHLFHGEEDEVVPVRHAWEAYEHLAELYGDVTLDTASSVGHSLHPVLIDRAVYRLQTCVPLRTWRRALGLD